MKHVFSTLAAPAAAEIQTGHTNSADPVQVEAIIPTYTATTGVSGDMKCVGSDSMLKLMNLWCQGFYGFYPGVKPACEGKGSNTAPEALIKGTASFGPMSREMKAAE